MTTGTPEPPRTTRGVPAWVPWVVTPLVVVLLGVSFDSVDLVAPDPMGGTAARYLPPDGQRTVSHDWQGGETVTEHTRSIGVEGAFAAPTLVTAELASRLGEEGLRRAQWWRASRVSSDGVHSTDLYRASPEGITQVASWGGEIGFVFEPELVVLPAEVQLGDTWSDSGSALADGVLTYTAESTALQAPGPYTDPEGREIPLTGGCLGVESEVRIDNPSEGFATTLIESTVWCPGRGPVWSSGTVDGEPVGQAEVRPGALAPVEAPTPASPQWRDVVAAATGLTPGRKLPLIIEDSFFGETEVTGQFPSPPSVTPDGRLATANDRGDDVEVWRLERDRAVLDWAGHPGGTIVAIGTVGDLVIATTSRRQVVAYDATGRRVWNWGADELVLDAPVSVRDLGGTNADVLVAARSGTVTVLDARTGIPRWSTSLGADTRTAPAVIEGLVLVADERERLTALDAATGAVTWRREIGLVARLAADAAAGLAVAVLDSGEVIALELADGAQRSTWPYRGIAQSVVITEGVVIVASDERTTAVDARSGEELWQVPGESALAGEGAAVALVQPAVVQLRSVTDGTLLGEQPIESGLVSSRRSALASGPEVVLFDSDGFLQRWALR